MPDPPDTATPPTFRHTLVRVMSMQIGTLLLLALLQLRYNS
jgi:hypothetical protein